jgi:hypothetical protein
MANNTPTPEELAAQNQALNIQKALSDVVIKGTDAIEKRRDLIEESHSLGNITFEQYSQQIDALNELEDLYKSSGKEAIRALQISINLQKKDLKETEKRIQAEKKLKAIKDKQYKSEKDIFAVLDKLGLGFIKNLKDQIRLHKELSKTQNAVLTGLNVAKYAAGAYLRTMTDLIVESDKMRSEYLKSTQANVSMASAVTNLSDRLRASGQDFKNAGTAMTGLYNNSVAYLDVGPEMRKEIEEQTSHLVGMGISAEDASKSFDSMVKVLGFSAPQATKELNILGQVAEDLNLSLNKVLKDMNEAVKKLAYSGKEFTKTFYRLEAQSRATGISVSGLLDIVGQFDTFEGAASAVSKLNGILGGPYLNSIEMVYMKEEDRIKTMRNMLKMSGRQFTSMSKFEKLAVMSAAGIKDMDTAQRLLGTSTRVYEEQQRKAKIAADEQKNFAKASKEAMTVVKKLQLSLMGLIVAIEPLLEEVIIPLIDSLAETASNMDESDRSTLAWTVGISGAASALWDLLAPITTAGFTAFFMRSAATGSAASPGLWATLAGWFKVAAGWAGSLFTTIGTALAPGGVLYTAGAAVVSFFGTVTSAVMGFVLGWPGLIIAAVSAIFVGLYMLWPEFRKATNQFAENVEQWWVDVFDFDLIDYLARKIETAMKYVMEYFPSSPVKRGPLVDMESAGEKVPDMLAKGFEKGYKVKVIPRMEALASSQKTEATNLVSAPATRSTPPKTLTPTRAQPDQKQNVQLVIDYKGAKRLLGEISGDLLEEAIGLRIA